MLLDLAQHINCPKWAPPESRYWNLFVHELWLRAKFYNQIRYSFINEVDAYRQHLKTFQKRPAVRMNIPALAANLVSRKLFAGKHAPHVISLEESVVESVKWLFKETKLDDKILDAAYWANAGSVGITIKLVDEIPVVSFWHGRFCWPKFDDAERLKNMTVAYCVDGKQWLDLYAEKSIYGPKDINDKPIVPGSEYWYIRVWDDTGVIVIRPIPYESWNPVDGDDRLLFIDKILSEPHDLGFVPAVWIRNLPGGDGDDGKATCEGVLDNCIELDYDLSTVGRGGRYASNPQLMVKGRVLNYDRGDGRYVMGPSQMLQLPADRKDGEQSVTGADAKIIEMSAQGLDVVMEKFVTHIRQWTHETIGISRKDPNTISGTMSGKAMELIDEDFIDLVQVGRVRLGEHGYKQIIILLGRMCIKAKHPKMKGVDHEMMEKIELEWPSPYSPSPQEAQAIVAAIGDAMDRGLVDDLEARTWLEKQIDKRTTSIEGQPNYKSKPKRKEEIEAENQIKVEKAKPKKSVGAK